jgi:hypothetical protein
MAYPSMLLVEITTLLPRLSPMARRHRDRPG